MIFVIIRDEEEIKIKADELASNSLEVFNYREALAIEVEKQRNRSGNNKSYPQIKREVEDRYKGKIESMQKVEGSIKRYEELSRAEISLKNLIYDMRKCGAYDDRSIQKILQAASRANSKNIQEEENTIAENVTETKGLLISSGLVKVNEIDEKTGMREVAFQSFKLDNRTVGIDENALKDVCNYTMKSIDRRNRESIKENKYEKAVRNYAYDNNIELEEAEKRIAQEDKEQRLGREYTKGLDEIETIKAVLEMRVIPTKIREGFSQEQIEIYSREQTKSREECRKYEEKFTGIHDKEQAIVRAKDVLMSLSQMESSVMNNRYKEKLRKGLEKFIKKEEKRLKKENVQLGKMRQSKSLDKYFENIDSYKEFVNANKRYTARRFGTHENLNDALDKGLINENEAVTVGNYDQEQMKQDEEFIRRMIEAEIYTAKAKGKNPMALPEPSKSSKYEKFANSLKVSEEQLLESSTRETSNVQEKQVEYEDSER